jgi:Zn-dependent protease
VLFALLHAGAVLVAGSTGWTPILETANRLFAVGVQLNVMLILFNLLPVPPLDGSHILYHFLPVNLGQAYRQLFPYGMFVLYILLFIGALGKMWDLAGTVTRGFLSVGNLVAG